MQEIAGTVYLLLPLLGGGIFHGLCLKYGWLAFLTRPIDAGHTWRGKPILGTNKTWRGIIAVGIGSALLLGVQAELLHEVGSLRAVELFDYGSVNGFGLGFLAGALAMLGELPNSLLKRRVGIAPGTVTRGGSLSAVLFFVLDQVDLLVGFWIALSCWVSVTPLRVALSVLVVFGAHQVVTQVAYRLGMRATPR